MKVSPNPSIFFSSLQAQVAFLQGERKGQENLKTDLVRRIKMLEYALKQERCAPHPACLGVVGVGKQGGSRGGDGIRPS